MRRLINSLRNGISTSCLVTALLLPVALSAAEKQPTAGEMIADAVIVRPAMLVVTTVTAATFVVTLPFSLLGGNVDDAAEKLLAEPAKYTFIRPLGTFEENYQTSNSDKPKQVVQSDE